MGVQLLQPMSGPSGNNATQAYGQSVRRGSLLVMAATGTDITSGATDTRGNVWVLASQSTVGGGGAAIYYAISREAGPCQVTATGAGANDDVWLWEVSAGMARPFVMSAKGLLDRTTSASGNSTNVDPGAMTPGYVGSFLVSACGAVRTFSNGASGWDYISSGFHGVETLIPTVFPASQDGTFTLQLSGAFDVVCAAFGFTSADAAAIVQPKAKPFLV